ncbi:manganese-dependent inorganic pyrophosphatase [Candidatus Parcubacteria bacterium]|nr:manganese-dependent inorganic pyrophosphatase [Candidatus Parcubacteria bacterium]
MSIYIIGHKSPDLDSVVAAITYSDYKNKTENTDKYVPVITEDINQETKYLLKNLDIAKPEILSNVENKELILVDHNEGTQSVEGVEKAKVIEVLDHHKIVFSNNEPIEFTVKPWGATCTIIADLYLKNNIEFDKTLATLMLGAILVDTVITKSPTCTQKDIEIIEKLSVVAEIKDWKEFGMEIFKVRSSVSELSDLEVIKSDFKNFELKAGKFGVGQVETVDLSDFKNREDSILIELEKLRNEGGYHSVVLFLTDIINEGSQFLVSTTDVEKIEKALNKKLINNRVYINGLISRKKQVAPKFSEIFN